MNSPRSRRGVPWRRWRDDALIALALALLAAGIALGGWAFRLDRVAYDLGLSLWNRPAPADIVIVAIDDASVQAIGRWPWSRAVHATMLQKLAEARPRAVALDLVLSEADPQPELDLLLAQALRAAGPVVLPMAWQDMGGGALAALEPTPLLRAAARLGAANPGVDGDGVLREAFLHIGQDAVTGKAYPGFALALLQAGGEDPHPRIQALAETLQPAGGSTDRSAPREGTRDGRFAIRFLGPPGTVTRISYAEVLAGTVAPERLAGRYVIVGMTAQGLGDTLATPVNGRFLAMPGAEVHANTVYTLRSGDGIATVSEAKVALLSALAVALLLAVFSRFGPRLALPLAMSSAPLAVVGSLLLLREGWWFSPLPYALTAVLAYPLWSWLRLERAVRRLDQEIASLLQMQPTAAMPPEPGTPGTPGRSAGAGASDSDQPDAAGDAPSAAPSLQAQVRSRRTDGDVLESRLHALRRAGQQVREARSFLDEALAALPTAMLVADAQARVLLANPRAAALFEVETAAELLGLDLIRLLGEFTPTGEPLDWAAALAAQRPAQAGLAVEVSLGEPAATSSAEHDAYVINVAVVELQAQRRWVVTIADVEPVKQAQRDREEVLAFVSHDLRSPASNLLMLAELNLQGRLQTPPAELLQEVKRLAGRSLAMSDGLVRATQVQTQKLRREEMALGDLVDGTLADVRSQALAAGVDLQADIESPSALVTVDPLLMARAIGNLLGNALRHAPAGSRVTLSGRISQGRLRLGVRDHGRGLSPQQLEQLARGDEGAAVRDAGGVGLGLLFVQRVARRHGGTLHARPPALGKGAYFEIDLPAAAG